MTMSNKKTDRTFNVRRDDGTTYFFELDNESNGEDPFIVSSTESSLVQSCNPNHHRETDESGVQQQTMDDDNCMMDICFECKANEEPSSPMSTKSSLEVQATHRTLPIHEVEDWPYEMPSYEVLKQSLEHRDLLKMRLMMKSAGISI